MASSGTSLKIEYLSSEGNSVTHTWKYISPSITTSQVKSIVATTIENGSIFETIPDSVVSAVLQTVSISEFYLD